MAKGKVVELFETSFIVSTATDTFQAKWWFRARIYAKIENSINLLCRLIVTIDSSGR